MVTHSSMAYVDKNFTIKTNVTTFLHHEDNRLEIVAGSSFNLSLEDAKSLAKELAEAIAELELDNR